MVLFDGRKKSMVPFCSSHMTVFILDISAPLVSVDLIWKKSQVISELDSMLTKLHLIDLFRFNYIVSILRKEERWEAFTHCVHAFDFTAPVPYLVIFYS